MFMAIIPTWVVRFWDTEEQHPGAIEFRVPSPQLDAFLKVLTFNDVDRFEVEREEFK